MAKSAVPWARRSMKKSQARRRPCFVVYTISGLVMSSQMRGWCIYGGPAPRVPRWTPHTSHLNLVLSNTTILAGIRGSSFGFSLSVNDLPQMFSQSLLSP